MTLAPALSLRYKRAFLAHEQASFELGQVLSEIQAIVGRRHIVQVTERLEREAVAEKGRRVA